MKLPFLSRHIAAAGRFQKEALLVQSAYRLLPLIRDEGFGQAVPPLLKIRNFHQGWPKLYRGFDDANHVIDNPQQVLLEEIGLEAVESLLQVGCEEPKRLRAVGFSVLAAPASARACSAAILS